LTLAKLPALMNSDIIHAELTTTDRVMFNEKFKEVSKHEFAHVTKKYDKKIDTDVCVAVEGSIMRITDNARNQEVAFAKSHCLGINKTRYYVLDSIMPPDRIH